jgi:hypothetical protein
MLFSASLRRAAASATSLRKSMNICPKRPHISTHRGLGDECVDSPVCEICISILEHLLPLEVVLDKTQSMTGIVPYTVGPYQAIRTPTK